MNDFSFKIAPRFGHINAENEQNPQYEPARQLVVVCHQHNGYNVHLRSYSPAMARYDVAAWSQFGDCKIIKRKDSIYGGAL